MSRASQPGTRNGIGGRRLARTVVAAVGLAAAVALAGCGAGQVSQTADQVSAVNGNSADIGPIAIRDAQLAPPAGQHQYYSYGSSAPVVVTIVNTGSAPDKLVSVASPVAGNAVVKGDTRMLGGTALRSGTDLDDHPAAQQTTSSTTSASLPRGQISITLTGLKVKQFRSGYTLPVTFTFAKAGKVTVNLPIGAPTGTDEKNTPTFGSQQPSANG